MNKWEAMTVLIVMIAAVLMIGLQTAETEKVSEEIMLLKLELESIKIEQNTVEYLVNLLEDYQAEILRLREILDSIGIDVFEVTAYAPFDNVSGLCNDGDPTNTATGTYPTSGRTIAVDPTVIPYGTEVWIEGYGWRTAEDTGGAIKGNKLDIMVDTYREAMSIGRKQAVVVYSIGG